MILAFGWSDLAYLALAIFLLLTGIALAYALLRLGAALGRASSLVRGAEQELLPVIRKAGGTVDRVNEQIDKVDQMTDSAVDAVNALDSAVRTVSAAVTRPIQKLAGLAEGLRHGASTLRARGGFGEAVQVAKDEAARRERELADDQRPAG